ncbi:3-phosphoshikimate 1-carboxyvinyltransferase [Bombilactobacillus bombi]|uniref:3-phosphoshikimate 1-carboxyvinyltransferase n=1 Tax=Bombilactobacillus bombi TaxID=1303590 RepID=A0A3R6W9L6_9LACO|nr:3-phosphoshikimate 1-carboxyvinyltransferase [Bombilactobacillus bombi]RHW50110.1 3-phosphoshikimate 1-carboxyvinyltransferase [Bombilactobacillus bombi]
MMNLQSQPRYGLHGTLNIPGDKSISHRALIIGALSHGTTHLEHFLQAEDCLSTLSALQALGVPITHEKETVTIHGQGLTGLTAPKHTLNMGNSGTTTRLLTGVLAGQTFTTTLIGDSSLSQRPMERVRHPLNQMGAHINLTAGHLPMTISGQNLRAITYQMPVASAQVKSAIILGALQAQGPSTIVELLPTRDHTERLLQIFGADIQIAQDKRTITIQPQPQLAAQDLIIPGDMSSAAFFITAASIVPNSHIKLTKINLNPTRTGLLSVLKRMGGNIHLTALGQMAGEPVGDIDVKAATLKPIQLTATDIPAIIDELPLVALLAASANGISKISGASELRVKETDRIACITSELQKLGINIKELPDGFLIDGRTAWSVRNQQLDSHKDHRIGMMLAIAALKIAAPLKLNHASAINISYPTFFQDLQELLTKETSS